MTEIENTIIDNVYRILVVDDEKEVLSAMHRTLLHAKQFKSEIVTVEDPRLALAELEKKEFDLILVDHRMPGMTGTELLHLVRDKYPDMVRIIVTGYSDIEIIKEAVNKAEIHYYIEKPWNNENVRSVIFEALKRKAVRESDKKMYSKERIMNWFMDLYQDIESMGTDLSFIEENIQVAKTAMESNDWDRALTYINHSFNLITECAEISTPKIELKLIENEQMPINEWSKINFEIHNKGGTDAKDIQLIPQGEFEIKPSEIIPSLKVNETKILQIEIFSKANGTFPLEIEISCKKPIDDTENKSKDVFWIRIGDVAGKTKIKRRFGYHKGYIKMELNIINEDLGDIKDVNLELIYNKDELKLSHINPKYNRLNNKFLIGNINSYQGKYIEIYFDPISCSKTTISGKVTFKDWYDFEKSVMVSEQQIRILCPVLSTTNSIGLTELKNLLGTELKFSGNKVITIPLGANFESSYQICKEQVFKYDVKLINEMFNENRQRVETWFYGTTEDMKNKFVIKLRIDNDTESMELFIASSNNAAITGLLTDLLSNLNKEFLSRGITQQPLRQLDNFTLREKFISAKQCMFYKQLGNIEQDLRGDLAQQIRYRSSPMAQKFENLSKRELVNMARGRHVNMGAKRVGKSG